MAYGKSIKLFLVNGTADSFVTAELSNWNGKAIKIPRIEVQTTQREELLGPGVYFLRSGKSRRKVRICWKHTEGWIFRMS